MNIANGIAVLKGYWKAALLVVAVFGVGYYLVSSRESETPIAETSPERVTRGDLRLSVSGSGQVEALSQVDLKPVIAGDGIDVIEVRVKNNQEVKKGQVIAVLDTEDARRDIENAELGLRSAELKQKQVNDQYDRDTKEDRWQRQTQEVAVQQGRNAVRKAQEKLQDYFVKAPFDGIVTGLSVEAGDSVSRDTVLASVITRDMRANIVLNEVDAAKVSEGDVVILSFDALPELSLTGKVSRIDTIGEIAQNVVSYGAEIVFDWQDGLLKPGMSVSADIVVIEKKGILLVPNAVLSVSSGKTTVRTQTGNKEVKTGLTDNVHTEIISGLSENDTVLLAETTLSAASASSQNGNRSIFNTLFRGSSSRSNGR